MLHVAVGALFGGVEAMLVALAAADAASGVVEARYALCADAGLAAALRTRGASVDIVGLPGLRRPLSVVRARAALRRLLESWRPDAVLIHGTWPYALLGSVATSLGIPEAMYAHDAPAAASWPDRLARWRRPALMLANSAFTASRARVLYRPVAMRVAHPVVAVRMATDGARARVRRELGAAPDAVVIAQVGRLEAWKGHATLLEAAARLRSARDWRIWIVGGAQRPAEVAYRSRLEARAQALGLADRLTFLGQRSDVADVLASADVLCQPNEGGEPFGIAMVEGMAAGLPVVASQQGAASEIVDATSGILVAPHDAGALAAALASLIDDPSRRARLGSGARERAAAFTDAVRAAIALYGSLGLRVERAA